LAANKQLQAAQAAYNTANKKSIAAEQKLAAEVRV